MEHPDHLINIMCYGDSNTYGYNSEKQKSRIPKKDRWTTILNELLGENYDVIVEGLNGRTTAYDKPGAPFQNGFTPFKAILGSHKPLDYIIFMLGTNDCNFDLNLEPEDIRDGMEMLIKEAKVASIEFQDFVPKILLIAPAHIRDLYPGCPYETQLDETSVSDSKAIGPLYKELAIKHGCLFYDAGDLEVSKSDLEHLTVESHKKLAHALAKIIQEEEKNG